MLITPRELANELGLPETTIAQWRYRHIGPSYLKVGRHVRYRREDVDRWIDGCTVTTSMKHYRDMMGFGAQAISPSMKDAIDSLR